MLRIYFIIAILCLFLPLKAEALEYRVRGQFISSFGFGEHGTFLSGKDSPPGFAPGVDNFEAKQKVALQLETKVSENLGGSLFLDIGDIVWGQADSAGALGSDGNLVEVGNAFLDWALPDLEIKIRMGLQGINIPALASGNSVFNGTTAALAANWNRDHAFGLTFFWARPYNNNYSGKASGYLDNTDVFSLLVPLHTGKAFLIPWAMYATLAPNTFRFRDNYADNPFGNLSYLRGGAGKVEEGMFPAGGARHANFTSANSERKINSHASAWWAGFTGSLDLPAALKLNFDMAYGHTAWEAEKRLNRHGYYGAFLLESSHDWGIPALYGWYSSGDDGNPSNGSERMPALFPDNSINFSHFAFDGAPYIERNALIGNTLAGTWGLGLRITHLYLAPYVSEAIRINYIRGTNSREMAQKMSLAGLWANGVTLTPHENSDGFNLGMPGLYMTEGDYAVELGTSIRIRQNENFSVLFSCAYIFVNLDEGTDAWGARHLRNMEIPASGDPWNLNVTFIYSF